MWPHSRADRRLTRLFLARFVENDLVAPGVDRRQLLATLASAALTLPAFAAMLLSVKYLFRPFQSPAWTLVTALDDQALLIGWTMAAAALAATLSWDALTVDARDRAILDPLPITRGEIARAKVTAVSVVAGVTVVLVSVPPALLHPVLTTVNLRAGLGVVLTLAWAQAVTTAAAGLTAFSFVVALNGSLQLLPSIRSVRLVSTTVRLGLLVAAAVAALLLPAAVSGTALLASTRATPMEPVLWFVGLQQRAGADRVMTVPVSTLPERTRRDEQRATVMQARAAAALRARASIALGLVGALPIAAVALVLLGARRAPPDEGGRRITPTPTHAAVTAFRHRGPAAAGAAFARRTLLRHQPHRVRLTIGAAATVAAIAVLGRVAAHAAPGEPLPLALLAVQPTVILIMGAGLNRALAIPPVAGAGWMFDLALGSDPWNYTTGVRRAALWMLLGVALAMTIALEAGRLAATQIAVHALLAVPLVCLVVDLSVLRIAGRPLVDGDGHDAGMPAAWPIAVLGGAGLVAVVALAQRALIAAPAPFLPAVAIVTTCVGLRALWLRRARRHYAPIGADATNLSGTQALGLSD